MASAPAVIGLVRKFAGDQFADHVADCLIPLDGAYARARQGANMVTDPSENIVTGPGTGTQSTPAASLIAGQVSGRVHPRLIAFLGVLCPPWSRHQRARKIVGHGKSRAGR